MIKNYAWIHKCHKAEIKNSGILACNLNGINRPHLIKKLLNTINQPKNEKQMHSQKTTNHEAIKAWVEAREGRPSIVRASKSEDSGILRIDFPGYSGDNSLEPISWDKFFQIFDKEGLQFLYQDTTEDGEMSNFNKFVNS